MTGDRSKRRGGEPSEPQGAPQAGGSRLLSGGLLVGLGYLAAAGSVSTDLYLPAFPDIAVAFEANASTVQLTLTSFMVGMALGQLLIGSLSDALGRRRTLVLALGVFAGASFLASASPSLGVLIAIRAVQGFAGAAGAVLARAVIADLVSPAQAVRALSSLWAMIALAPVFASPLGAWLTQLGGWRLTLLGLAVVASGMFVVALLVVPETLPVERRHALRFGVLAGNIGRLLRHRVYVGYTIAFAAGYGGLIVYIGSSSFLVQEVLGLDPLGYALTFSLSSLSVMLGAWTSGRISLPGGVSTTLRIAQICALTAGGTLLILVVGDLLTLGSYLPLVCLFTIGCGAIMSICSSLAIGYAGGTAGAGSALVGFAQFSFGALASPLGGILGPATALPAAFGMTGFAVLGILAAVFARAGERRIPHGTEL